MPWKPWLGSIPAADKTSFRVWAPRADSLSVRIIDGPTVPLARDQDGYFSGSADGVRAGARYLYRFPDGRERPDPASLLQPEGVHGPSEVVALEPPRVQAPGTPLERLVTTEIHLGTFTPEGTADAAAARCAGLAEDGFNALEIMPVAAFPGARNWGYDGINPFSAHAAYGGPKGLARLVDAAHRAGLRVLLDVVYNHLGPEGNYLGEFGPYFTSRHKTPWGDGLDFESAPVRRYFIESALRWVASVGGGFDGLRLDAVHGILDDSPRHVLQELAEAVHREASETGRAIHVIAESDLNDCKLIESYGLDSAWADDFHHALHVALTGERQGYYQDFAVDPVQLLASAINQGWHYSGQLKPTIAKPHGTPARHLPGRRFVVCAQNHDQIGNRARGERLGQLTDTGGLRVAAAVLALQPALPLYFQGEEWAAPEPFQYFVSHGDPGLVEAVRNGRREEFKSFAWAGEVPDPQAEETFARSRVDWSKRDSPAGKAALDWHRSLLQLRREHPALQSDAHDQTEARVEDQTLLLRRFANGQELLLVASFAEGAVSATLPAGSWRLLLDSGEADLAGNRAALRGRHAIVLEKIG
jgi:maltooligosyltrehalose trehalohydrolase